MHGEKDKTILAASFFFSINKIIFARKSLPSFGLGYSKFLPDAAATRIDRLLSNKQKTMPSVNRSTTNFEAEKIAKKSNPSKFFEGEVEALFYFLNGPTWRAKERKVANLLVCVCVFATLPCYVTLIEFIRRNFAWIYTQQR